MFHSHVENLEKRRKSSWCNELVSINGESRCYRASSFYEVIPYFKKIEANNRQHWRIWKTDLWYLPSISMLAVSHASCLDSFQVSNFNQISLIFSFSPQFYWIVVDFRFSTFTFHSKEIIIQSHLLTSESTSTELNLVICKIITYIVAIIIFQFKSFQSNKFDDIKSLESHARSIKMTFLNVWNYEIRPNYPYQLYLYWIQSNVHLLWICNIFIVEMIDSWMKSIRS